MISIRSWNSDDADAVWSILEPIIRAGDTYTLPRNWDQASAIKYWTSPENTVFVAEEDGVVIGTYFIRANQNGGGAHVCNCGYMTAPHAIGRGVARAMCAHSLEHAIAAGYRAMQFNFVISTNERAIKLWQQFDFLIVGRLPEAFLHPTLGYVDALVMFRTL